MLKIPKDPVNTASVAKIWIFFVLLSLAIFLFFIGKTYYTFDAIGIWILSCIALLYLSKGKMESLEGNQKIKVIILGAGLCIFSCLSLPLGISKPPYSIGEYSVFLSGVGLILFGSMRVKTLLLPVAIPSIAVLGYDGYRLFLVYADKLTAPFIPFTVTLSTMVLNLIGIPTLVYDGNIISFLSQSGAPISLAIIGECTGIVSLGTFTIAVGIVLSTFPRNLTRGTLGIIAIGYLGTYAANIGRIVLIALSGYYYGPSGLIEQVHIHIGWILFSSWMIIFWYYYFTRVLGFSFFGKSLTEKK